MSKERKEEQAVVIDEEDSSNSNSSLTGAIGLSCPTIMGARIPLSN